LPAVRLRRSTNAEGALAASCIKATSVTAMPLSSSLRIVIPLPMDGYDCCLQTDSGQLRYELPLNTIGKNAVNFNDRCEINS
jgi:hypothetical protein